MESTEKKMIREVIGKLIEQMDLLDASMSVDVLTKSVLKKDEICNILIRIAQHKGLIERLETVVGDALNIDIKRITDSLNTDDAMQSTNGSAHRSLS